MHEYRLRSRRQADRGSDCGIRRRILGDRIVAEVGNVELRAILDQCGVRGLHPGLQISQVSVSGNIKTAAASGIQLSVRAHGLNKMDGRGIGWRSRNDLSDGAIHVAAARSY